MTLSDTVAITALVVSLVALVIALLQLSQSIFLTADGYRNCSSEVIGVWAKRRRRVFVPSEFRLATKFTTPDIRVVATDEVERIRLRGHFVCSITAPNMESHYVEVAQTIQPSGYVPWPRSGVKSGESSSPSPRDVEQRAIRVQTLPPLTISSRTHAEPLVTWASLLREVHKVYVYNGSQAPRPGVAILVQEGETCAVLYIERSWDFLPPDLVRPPASTNLGSIVNLALRLGMQWRLLDPGNGKLLANGNGYSLSTTDIKGLGIVLTFSSIGDPKPVPFIPTRAVSQMMCGILPACPRLVRRTQGFEVIEDILEKGDRVSLKTTLVLLGVAPEVIHKIEAQNLSEAHNEAIILLCPYLPVSGQAMWKTCTALFRSDTRSVFSYWEGRLALVRRLQDRIKNTERFGQPSEMIVAVYTRLTSLQDRYNADFFCRLFESQLRGRRGSGEVEQEAERLTMLHDLREVHDWTSDYFCDRGWSDDYGTGITRYARLVGAHIALSVKAVEMAAKTQEERKNWNYDFSAFRYYGFVQGVYELGRAYGNLVLGKESSLLETLHAAGALGNGAKFSRDAEKNAHSKTEDEASDARNVEEAWWVMVLRGIVWTMSVEVDTPGQPIPSWIFENKTPVWIT
ncbi:hypothetical protein BAUCODRAFT_147358 [Baudoinia panamericana UAMH 10762]|uniref:Uncharacterized protein n=1 Tax=Baudoinia panamericana (strain UAMH 10762) TaxID=717646 RepID=M2NE42_BAUPA|nr:uncharacterized protein BAUCODRAFT_147358 [Baudoinia panamericana UAMH 10762]EMC97210.1 hypothetical protein BAUCODRAFT_147358 [Baudoinia panamericana UAMH 10762]